MVGNEIVISSLAWAVGVIVVTIFSWNFFNAGDYYLDSSPLSREANKDKLDFREPLLPIFATSRSRYRKWFVVFLLFTLSLYVLITYAIGEQAKSNSLEWYKSYNQIFAAFIISGFVNVLPKNLQHLDVLRWARYITHVRAKIPSRARSIFTNIMTYEMTLTEKQIESSIEHVGSEYLKKDNFSPSKISSEQNTIEKNWSKACHLFTCINAAAKDANSRYASNLAGPELVYDQALHNFQIIKEDIKNYHSNKNNMSPESLRERTRLLLKQVSQLFVCLVFSSEKTEEDIFKKLKDTGISLKKRISYDLNISTIAISMLSFAAVTWLSVYALAFFTEKTKVGPSTTHLISLSAVLIICAPIMLTFFIKTMSSETWPVRGQHSARKNLPFVIMFALGIGIGLMGFYAMSRTALFTDTIWYELWPYTIMSGVISALAVFVIDLKPRIVDFIISTKRAVLLGCISLILFVLIAMFSIIVVGEINPDPEKIKFAIKENEFTLAISAMVGFLSGIIISYIADYSTRIKNKNEERLITLSEYVLPKLGYVDVAHLDYDKLNQKFNSIKDELPNSLINYLKEIEFIMSDESMPNESVNQLKSDMRKHRDLETA